MRIPITRIINTLIWQQKNLKHFDMAAKSVKMCCRLTDEDMAVMDSLVSAVLLHLKIFFRTWAGVTCYGLRQACILTTPSKYRSLVATI